MEQTTRLHLLYLKNQTLEPVQGGMITVRGSKQRPRLLGRGRCLVRVLWLSAEHRFEGLILVLTLLFTGKKYDISYLEVKFHMHRSHVRTRSPVCLAVG